MFLRLLVAWPRRRRTEFWTPYTENAGEEGRIEGLEDMTVQTYYCITRVVGEKEEKREGQEGGKVGLWVDMIGPDPIALGRLHIRSVSGEGSKIGGRRVRGRWRLSRLGVWESWRVQECSAIPNYHIEYYRLYWGTGSGASN